MCSGALIDTLVEVSTVGMCLDVVIIASNVAVDLLADTLPIIIRGDLTNIAVDMLVEVNEKVFAGVMIAFEFIMPERLEEFGC